MRRRSAIIAETICRGSIDARWYDANAFDPFALRIETDTPVRFTMYCESNRRQPSRS